MKSKLNGHFKKEGILIVIERVQNTKGGSVPWTLVQRDLWGY